MTGRDNMVLWSNNLISGLPHNDHFLARYLTQIRNLTRPNFENPGHFSLQNRSVFPLYDPYQLHLANQSVATHKVMVDRELFKIVTNES